MSRFNDAKNLAQKIKVRIEELLGREMYEVDLIVRANDVIEVRAYDTADEEEYFFYTFDEDMMLLGEEEIIDLVVQGVTEEDFGTYV